MCDYYGVGTVIEVLEKDKLQENLSLTNGFLYEVVDEDLEAIYIYNDDGNLQKILEVEIGNRLVIKRK